MLQAPALHTLEPQAKPPFAQVRPAGCMAHKLSILLVEDIGSDAILTKIALDAAHVPYALSKIRHGNEVLPYLRIRKKACPEDLPDLILLDLGLPGMDGFEILAELTHASPGIRSIPLVILTAYPHFEYLRSTYPHLHIIEHLAKPCSAEKMRPILAKVLSETKGIQLMH